MNGTKLPFALSLLKDLFKGHHQETCGSPAIVQMLNLIKLKQIFCIISDETF